jgi:S-adenosyl-L-methionine hydrolase (adenosine-forming)
MMIRKTFAVLIFILIAKFGFAARPIIVFMTDFGTVDDSVAICKGVMLQIAPEAEIIDLSHQITPYSIEDAARFLAGTTPYYPGGTVFLSVIDPGVGSPRKAIIAKSKKGHYFVLPDNGLITLVQDQEGIEEAREIANPAWTIGKSFSSTFHGRDIFSPAAAHLAAGQDWTQVGPVVPNLVRLQKIKTARMVGNRIEGDIIGTDGPFGNLISNIPADMFQQLGIAKNDKVLVEVGSQKFEMPFVKTFSDVPADHILMYVDSRGRIAIAVNEGNFAKKFRIATPATITINHKSAEEN